MKYESVIGLEIHAELNTKTKAFCSCNNSFTGEVNTHICPGCLAMPGTLPVFNEQMLKHTIKAGKAMNCTINKVCKQDRKHYFYPDLPHAYQISQLDMPLCQKGRVDFFVDGEKRSCRLNRIHMEEDASKLLHEAGFSGSLVDFNRGGVALIEIVTEPDLRSADEVKAFLETVRSILMALDVCDGKMQEGSIRCDVNVSVRPEGESKLGTRVEMKNVNTFSGAWRAVTYEAARQIKVLTTGGVLEQETRRWDDEAGVNIVMRTKENAQDYRYFPDPDLLPVVIDDAYIDAITIPELPHQKMERFMLEYGLGAYEASLLSENRARAAFIDACVQGGASAKQAANWILGDISKELNEKEIEIDDTKLTAQALTDMIALIEKGDISGAAGKKVLSVLLHEGGDAAAVVDALGLRQVNDESALLSFVVQAMEANPKSVADYRAGKTNAMGFLVGQCMRASKGKGNPTAFNKLLQEALDKPE